MNDIITKTPVTIAGRPMVRLDVPDTHILHRIGSEDYTPIRHTTVDADRVADYEALTLADADAIKAARAAEADYKTRVVALIRARYDQDDENAILRQRDTKPDEFAVYNAYVEHCKARVKAEMEAERLAEEEAERLAAENKNIDTADAPVQAEA